MATSTLGLLSLKEAAEALGRPEATLRYWRSLGCGPRSARVGGRVVYRESDLRAWIEAQFEAEAE